MSVPPGLAHSVRRLQRALIVLFALVPLTLVTLAFLPALLVLPFVPAARPRTEGMLRQLTAWSRAVLHGSRER
ncbi:hypothetical protein ACODT3_21900 [Streptomyces sp. 4.24]|uniref:hypothetical protein n=1 Tax=Streptomyces tritrimontium TaxID=3406573 RepID=UPI003BB50F43